VDEVEDLLYSACWRDAKYTEPWAKVLINTFNLNYNFFGEKT
jgi:hypothetical protein